MLAFVTEARLASRFRARWRSGVSKPIYRETECGRDAARSLAAACGSTPVRRAGALALAVACCLASSLRAQTPNYAMLIKLDGYHQTSAETVAPIVAGVTVAVGFETSVPAATTIRVTSPTNEVVELTRDPEGDYEATRFLASAAERDAAFPDGTYRIAVINGGATTTTSVVVQMTGPIAPTRITNFDALQSWSGPRPRIEWDPIPKRETEFFSIAVAEAGEGRFETSESFSARATSVETSVLPMNRDLTGTLTYAAVTVTTPPSSRTGIAVGRGFTVVFPLRAEAPAPVIRTQPQSIPLSAGTTWFAFAVAEGYGPMQYKWYKDGVAIPGTRREIGATSAPTTVRAELTLTGGGLGDAGMYEVAFTNTGGTTLTEPAYVVVPPWFEGSFLAGTFQSALPPADGPRATAILGGVQSITFDRQGNLYFFDGALRRLNVSGEVTTIAGAHGTGGHADGKGSAARFETVISIAVGADGTIWVGDTLNRCLRKVAPDGTVSTFAGKVGERGFVDGPAAEARFGALRGLVIDAAGNLLFADLLNRVIRKVSPAGVVSTVAGSGAAGSGDGIGRAAHFQEPSDLAFDPAGNLLVLDGTTIRRISPDGTVVTLVRGLAYPSSGLAVDRDGNIHVAYFNLLSRYSPDGISQVQTNLYFRWPGVPQSLGRFESLAIAPDGAVVAADSLNRVIVRATVQPGSPHRMAILTSPQPATVGLDSAVMLEAAASGPALRYQWTKDGVAIAGATDARLFVERVQPADAGQYAVAIYNGAGQLRTNPVRLEASATPDTGRLANLSILSHIASEASPLIMGVAIGRGSGDKPLLARAIGPGLREFGVPDALGDPTLTLFRGSETLARNDNWSGTEVAAAAPTVGAFPLVAGSLDAATIFPADNETYTLMVTPRAGTGGIALAELYDLNAGVTTRERRRMINVSSRMDVPAGGALTAGFVIRGSTAKTVLIRGVGPSLAGFGVPAPMPDPEVELYAGSTALGANRDWNSDPLLRTVGDRVGAFPLTNAKDAAILVTLPPGQYSVRVRDRDRRAGTAIVEVYDVP